MCQQDNAPRYKALIELEWFQEPDAEFLEFLNSPDLNRKEHIWDVMYGSSEFKYHEVATSLICVTVA